MNILFIATESVPYCKTGGLADVVRGLARELCRQGHDVRVAIPCYRGLLDRERMQEIISGLKVPLGTYSREASVWKADDKPITYLIQQDFYFGRDEFYGYLDDYERFIFFTRAALEMLSASDFQQQENEWFPEIIQGYDWATGFVPMWLHEYEYEEEAQHFLPVRFVLSIHNIGWPGMSSSRALRVAQQEAKGIFPQLGEKTERINVLGRGILFADKVVTVNPEYREENPLPESVQILETVVSHRFIEGDFVGIRNAIDYEDYDPSSDPCIYKQFDERTLQNRLENKLCLQQELGFKQGEHIPLLGMVSSLFAVKGFDLFQEFKEQILDPGDVQFVMLAEPGNDYYMRMFQQWEQDWNAQQKNDTPWIKILYGFDEKLARRIYASCDVFLLPSKEEPCGIQQFIAMHYGAVPVVHGTGALHSFVIPYQAGMKLRDCRGQGKGVGFTFTNFSSETFIAAVQTAIQLYTTDQQAWCDIQRHNMREDFSWVQPAEEYIELYQRVLPVTRMKIEQGTPLQLNRDTQLVQTLLGIDSLPGLRRRNSREILKQVARLVREVLNCDAVYVWTLGEGKRSISGESTFQKMQLADFSLARQDERIPPERSTVNELLNQGASNAWQQFSYLDRGGPCKPVSGLRESALAKEANWIDGRTVPITANSRVLGRIDVLFNRKIESQDDEWFDRALITLANSLGFRLETIRFAQESDQIVKTDNELLRAQSVTEVARKVIEQAKVRSGADEAWLYLYDDERLKSAAPSAMAEAGLAAARSAFDTQKVVYIRDTRINDYNEQFLFRSLMAVPLLHSDNKAIGVLEVAKKEPAAFSRDDEQILSEHLVPQAVATLQTNRQHAQRDQNRVDQLKKLAASLIGGGNFNRLLEDVVTATAEVLESQAASLYLVNKDTGNLEIKAAAGYHKPLLDENVSYSWGEKGITGWIWKEGKIFKADSLEELHKPGVWAGKTRNLQGKEPNAYLGIPLKIKEQVIGVLKFEDRNKPSAVFNDEDVRLGEMMANVIAAVVYNAQQSEKRLRDFGVSLRELSEELAGSRDMPTLMDNIIKKIAQVLHVDAASLYLADEIGAELVIQAAAGYQESLVKDKVKYKWGQGVTGKIAADKKAVVTQSLEELRFIGGKATRGTYDHLHKEQFQPQSFYGLPLIVKEQEQAIGVLKVESIQERFFSNEDVLLIEMMANVIATVVYNTQVSEKRLQELSTNLNKLSNALVGSQNMQTLMDNIMNTITEVIQVDAATLYLTDDRSQRLVIQAAHGYQKALLAAKAFYEWGEGVTGRIAQTNQPIRANSLKELRKLGGGKKGKYDDLQGGKRPNSFYGLPLNVKGRDKPIGVLKVESLSGRFLTNEDISLIEIMANIIATVVYNAQLDRVRLGSIAKELGTVDMPLEGAAQKLLIDFARSPDYGILELLASTVSVAIGSNKDRAYKEAIALWQANANPELYFHIADISQEKSIKRCFNLFYQATRAREIEQERLGDVYGISRLWADLEEENKNLGDFGIVVETFIQALGEACKAEVIKQVMLGDWCGLLLNTTRTFENTYLPRKLPFVFHRNGFPQKVDDLEILRRLLVDSLGDQKLVILPLWCKEKDLKRTRTMLRHKLQQPFAIDTIVLDIEQIQRVVGASRPDIELQRIILPPISLLSISPYKIVGPTDVRVFFGREQELRQISDNVHGTSFAVIGGRRIGKTSILHQLHFVRLPAVNFRTIYYDCSIVSSHEHFLTDSIRNWQPAPPSNFPNTFRELFQSVPTDKPLVLLLDEVDKLVPDDRVNNWRLFNALRALAGSGHAQVVLSGERTLRETLRDPKSPLFNFVNEILLGPLDFRAVEELVIRPMKLLEIELIDEKSIVERIWDFTSGHPNVVQRLCSRLIQRLNKQGIRRINLEDVNAVIENPHFQRDDFFMTYWEAATPLEKIISLLMADNEEIHNLQVLRQALERCFNLRPKSRELNDALQRLTDLRFILSRTPDGYKFAVKAFPRVVAKVIPLEDMLEAFIEEYREETK